MTVLCVAPQVYLFCECCGRRTNALCDTLQYVDGQSRVVQLRRQCFEREEQRYRREEKRGKLRPFTPSVVTSAYEVSVKDR